MKDKKWYTYIGRLPGTEPAGLEVALSASVSE